MTQYDDLHVSLTLRYLLSRGEKLALDYDLEAFNGWIEKHVTSPISANDRVDAEALPMVGWQHAGATGYSFWLYDAGDTIIVLEDMPPGPDYMALFNRAYLLPWPTPSFKKG